MGMILSFLTGIFLTWLFFSWRIDREHSVLCRRIIAQNIELEIRKQQEKEQCQE